MQTPPCAVGCLMTPSHQEKMKDFQGGVLGVYDHHRDTLEGIVGESLPDYLSCVVPIADYPEKIRFLYDMQGSHDEAAMGYSPTFHETFRVHLTTLADAWLLTVPQEEVAA